MPPIRRRRAASHTPINTQDGPPIHSVMAGRSPKKTLIIYGEPGSGKTVLAATSADLPAPENRTLILRTPMDHTDSISNEKVQEWVLHDWAEFDDALLHLRHDGANDWDWVWLDGISLTQDVTLDDIWAATVKAKPERAKYDVDKGEYGVNMNRLARWVRHMVGTPNWNFGITAHQAILTTVEQDREAEDKLMPWIQGKNMSPKICGYTNLVAYLEVRKGGQRRLHTDSSERWYAKNQFKPPDSTDREQYLDNPTMPRLLEFLTNGTRSVGGTAQGVRPNRRRTRSRPQT